MNKSKHLLLFILLLVQFQIVQAQFLPYYDRKESWNGLSMMNLKGKVKSLKQVSYLTKDSLGTITKAKKTTQDQISVRSDCVIEFDNKGRTIKETYYNLLGGGGDTLVHVYEDEKRVEEITDQGSNGKIYFKYSYKYDMKGRIIEDFMSQFITDNNRFDQKIIYKYDNKGNRIEHNYYTSENNNLNTEEKTIYKYQKIEDLNLTEGYNEKGNIRTKFSYKVNSKGNKIEENYYTADCKVLEHILRFKYNDYGNEIQKEYYRPGDKFTKVWSYKYEYDKSNNWIKRTDFENGKATYILERTLGYY